MPKKIKVFAIPIFCAIDPVKKLLKEYVPKKHKAFKLIIRPRFSSATAVCTNTFCGVIKNVEPTPKQNIANKTKYRLGLKPVKINAKLTSIQPINKILLKPFTDILDAINKEALSEPIPVAPSKYPKMSAFETRTSAVYIGNSIG
jgi:hypothetical protein